jgi:hypothetical protein
MSFYRIQVAAGFSEEDTIGPNTYVSPGWITIRIQKRYCLFFYKTIKNYSSHNNKIMSCWWKIVHTSNDINKSFIKFNEIIHNPTEYFPTLDDLLKKSKINFHSLIRGRNI